MKSLVFGRRGLVGSALLQQLRLSGDVYEVQTSIRWRSKIEAAADLQRILSGFRTFIGNEQWAIYWAAGKGHLGSTYEEMRVEEELLELLCASISNWNDSNGILVLMSSAGAVWASASPGQICESTPTSGTSPYAKSKLRQEALVARLCQQRPVRGLVMRLSSVYGVNQDLSKPQGLISRLCIASVMRRPIEVFVPLETTRNYIHAVDAAKMIIAATTRIAQGPSLTDELEMRIICSRDNHSIASVCRAVEVITRRKLLIACRLTDEAKRYPLHFQLESQYAKEFSCFESSTLISGISTVHRAITFSYQTGQFAAPCVN